MLYEGDTLSNRGTNELNRSIFKTAALAVLSAQSLCTVKMKIILKLRVLTVSAKIYLEFILIQHKNPLKISFFLVRNKKKKKGDRISLSESVFYLCST